MRRPVQATGKQKLITGELRLCDPGLDGFTRLFGQLKLNRSMCLPLHDDRARCYAAFLRHVTDPQTNQIAAAQFTVDSEIEKREIARSVGQLQADPNCPDLL
jgi:hypothetical protein